MSEPKLVPTTCACCGQVKEAREYRISHKHHKDFRYIGTDGKVKYQPDTWSSECRVCRAKRAKREAYALKVENARSFARIEHREVVREVRAAAKTDELLRLSRLKFAKSQYLKAIAVDKQQLKRMDARDRKLQNTARLEKARAVRNDHILAITLQYQQQLIDIQEGRRPEPLNKSDSGVSTKG
jgi:hypothetical protein